MSHKNVICSYWEKGECKFGDNCKYAHNNNASSARSRSPYRKRNMSGRSPSPYHNNQYRSKSPYNNNNNHNNNHNNQYRSKSPYNNNNNIHNNNNNNNNTQYRSKSPHHKKKSRGRSRSPYHNKNNGVRSKSPFATNNHLERSASRGRPIHNNNNNNNNNFNRGRSPSRGRPGQKKSRNQNKNRGKSPSPYHKRSPSPFRHTKKSSKLNNNNNNNMNRNKSNVNENKVVREWFQSRNDWCKEHNNVCIKRKKVELYSSLITNDESIFNEIITEYSKTDNIHILSEQLKNIEISTELEKKMNEIKHNVIGDKTKLLQILSDRNLDLLFNVKNATTPLEYCTYHFIKVANISINNYNMHGDIKQLKIFQDAIIKIADLLLYSDALKLHFVPNTFRNNMLRRSIPFLYDWIAAKEFIHQCAEFCYPSVKNNERFKLNKKAFFAKDFDIMKTGTMLDRCLAYSIFKMKNNSNQKHCLNNKKGCLNFLCTYNHNGEHNNDLEASLLLNNSILPFKITKQEQRPNGDGDDKEQQLKNFEMLLKYLFNYWSTDNDHMNFRSIFARITKIDSQRTLENIFYNILFYLSLKEDAIQSNCNELIALCRNGINDLCLSGMNETLSHITDENDLEELSNRMLILKNIDQTKLLRKLKDINQRYYDRRDQHLYVTKANLKLNIGEKTEKIISEAFFEHIQIYHSEIKENIDNIWSKSKLHITFYHLLWLFAYPNGKKIMKKCLCDKLKRGGHEWTDEHINQLELFVLKYLMKQKLLDELIPPVTYKYGGLLSKVHDALKKIFLLYIKQEKAIIDGGWRVACRLLLDYYKNVQVDNTNKNKNKNNSNNNSNNKRIQTKNHQYIIKYLDYLYRNGNSISHQQQMHIPLFLSIALRLLNLLKHEPKLYIYEKNKVENMNIDNKLILDKLLRNITTEISEKLQWDFFNESYYWCVGVSDTKQNDDNIMTQTLKNNMEAETLILKLLNDVPLHSLKDCKTYLRDFMKKHHIIIQ